MSINLIATTTFGLEAVVKRECQALGFQNIKTSDGKVEFTGDESDIVKANLWLRCAGRVWVKMGTFTAVTFTELFDRTKALHGRLDSGGREIHRCGEIRKIHPVQRFGLSGNRQEGCCRKAEGKI